MSKFDNIILLHKRLATVLCFVFAIQIANQALFYHAHVIDGQVYAHAHPGNQERPHSNYELSFYAQLQLLCAHDTPVLLADYIPFFIRDIQQKTDDQYCNFTTYQAKGRAPPAA